MLKYLRFGDVDLLSKHSSFEDVINKYLHALKIVSMESCVYHISVAYMVKTVNRLSTNLSSEYTQLSKRAFDDRKTSSHHLYAILQSKDIVRSFW